MLERLICLLLCISVPLDSYAKAIRQLQFNENQVPEIHTAIGFSTILEFPSRPISAVLGDQDAFKLEYVGNSITIKPLVSHAKSNLFVFTEFERFNCTLRAGNPHDVDYVVKIKVGNPPDLKTNASTLPKPTLLNRSKSQNGFSFKIITVTYPKNSTELRSPLIINFELSLSKGHYAFAPGAIGVRQNNRFLSIESIYLETFELDSRKPPIKGTVVLLLQDLSSQKSTLEVVFAALKANKKVFRLSIKIPVIKQILKEGVPLVSKSRKN